MMLWTLPTPTSEESDRPRARDSPKATFAALALLAAACGSGNGGTEPEPETPEVVTWAFDGQSWVATGEPPPCPTEVVFPTPIDLTRVTSVLYPGQIRGGSYKPHGGFRFDGADEDGALSVVLPMASSVLRASRYLQGGELQYLFDFIHPCGILHRLDHLREPSAALQAVADGLPPAVEGDSRTTQVPAGTALVTGEVIATAVGFVGMSNYFVDWGVYDLRARNAASQDPEWLAAHPGELAPYALCWFENLPPADEAVVRALPPADGVSGAMSDYCR